MQHLRLVGLRHPDSQGGIEWVLGSLCRPLVRLNRDQQGFFAII